MKSFALLCNQKQKIADEPENAGQRFVGEILLLFDT